MTPLDFTPPQPVRRAGESVVPMINVVFLLLIFFLMSAVIAPPDALDVTPPTGTADERAEPGDALLMDAQGTLAFGTVVGDAALEAVPVGAVVIRADSAADGAALARVIARLAARGITDVTLTVAAR